MVTTIVCSSCSTHHNKRNLWWIVWTVENCSTYCPKASYDFLILKWTVPLSTGVYFKISLIQKWGSWISLLCLWLWLTISCVKLAVYQKSHNWGHFRYQGVVVAMTTDQWVVCNSLSPFKYHVNMDWLRSYLKSYLVPNLPVAKNRKRGIIGN